MHKLRPKAKMVYRIPWLATNNLFAWQLNKDLVIQIDFVQLFNFLHKNQYFNKGIDSKILLASWKKIYKYFTHKNSN